MTAPSAGATFVVNRGAVPVFRSGAASATPIVAAVGIPIGALYTLSPIGAWFAAWMALVFRWAALDTTLKERRWVLGALSTALALRVIAIAILPFTIDPTRHSFTSYFGDAVYTIQRSIWIRNVYVGVPVAARDYFEAFEPVFGYSVYNYVLAYLHVLFGPSPYGIALVSTGLFLTAAVMIYRRGRVGFGRLPAFAGLAALVFLPSWFAWSVAPLKEAMQFFLIAAAIEGTLVMMRGGRRAKLAGALVVAGAIVVNATLRNGSSAILVGGMASGVLLYVATRRWWIAAVLVVVMPLVALRVAERPVVRQRVTATVLDAAKRHVGHTFSTGAYYRLLDERFYMIHDFPEPMTMNFEEGVRFLGRAPVALLLEPLPWALDSPKWLVAVPHQVVWYALLVLSAFGVAAGGRRDAALTGLFVGLIACAVAIIAPNSGNIGTAMRHREMISPFVAALAGIGGQAIANRFAQAGKKVMS